MSMILKSISDSAIEARGDTTWFHENQVVTVSQMVSFQAKVDSASGDKLKLKPVSGKFVITADVA